jgi:23S rRNA G2445 N2-methylase RlmL
VNRHIDGGEDPRQIQPQFYLSVVQGMERIAGAEARRAGAHVTGTRPGKVFLRYQGDVGALLELRSALGLQAFIAEHHGCPADAGASAWLHDRAREIAFEPALAAHASLREAPGQPSFRVTAARSGEHAFTSVDAAAWAGAGVQALTEWSVDLEHWHYHIEVEIAGDRALFGLRLGESWAERRRKPAHHPASLNPTVAYAMIQMCGTQSDDVFLDPACGGGTLLEERAALAPAEAIIGGDIWPPALEYARRNLRASGTEALLVRWDARELPLCSESVARAGSNLPFGHRVGHGPIVRSLYRRLVPEVVRVLVVGGRAALLTSRRRWLRLVIGDNPKCHCERTLRIVLGGKEAFIFVVRRVG